MIKQLIWHIDEAVLVFCDEAEKTAWAHAGMPLSFEFDPTLSDDCGEIVVSYKASQYFEIEKNESTIRIRELDAIRVVINAWVFFNIEINSRVTNRRLELWSTKKGGWECGTISSLGYDSFIESDSGGDLRISLSS